MLKRPKSHPFTCRVHCWALSLSATGPIIMASPWRRRRSLKLRRGRSVQQRAGRRRGLPVLTETLVRAKGPFRYFAPTIEALAKISGQPTFKALLQDTETLTAILTYNCSGKVLQADASTCSTTTARD